VEQQRAGAIDVHCHMVPPDVLAFLEREGEHYATRVGERDGQRVFIIEETATRPINARVLGTDDGAARLQDMDAEGIATEAVSCVPFVMYPSVEPDRGLAVAQVNNDALAGFAKRNPDRFVAVASVPLQAPELAARELERAAALGHRAVMIPPKVGARGLDEPVFEPFWDAAEALRLPIFIHPFEAAPSGVLARYALGNLVGNLYDTGLAAVLLICGGVLERHPGLRFILAHAGGTLPAVIGRVDNGYARAADMRRTIPRPPASYLDRFWYDTIALNPALLRALMGVYGSDRFVVGSDYPVGGTPHPVSDVRALGLDAASEALVLRGTAERLLEG
jgi:aminocarboxymuconate-semialdehyde decarboxylase